MDLRLNALALLTMFCIRLRQHPLTPALSRGGERGQRDSLISVFGHFVARLRVSFRFKIVCALNLPLARAGGEGAT